jgi:hypothetical protein
VSSVYRCPACIVLRDRQSVSWKVAIMLVWEIQAQYSAARECDETDTIKILQAQAREIAKAEAHSVARWRRSGIHLHLRATLARVCAETLLGAQREKTTPRSVRSRK